MSFKEVFMLGNRIRKLRERLKINQTVMAEHLKIKPSAICQMESGRIRPSLETVIEMARIWDVNLHWLLTGVGPMFMEGSPNRRKARAKLKKVSEFISGELDQLAQTRVEDQESEIINIPVSGEIAAGKPVQSVEPQLEFLTVRRGMIRGVLDDYVCLRVNGRSMEPEICNNDLVLIRQSKDWYRLSGQICAVRVDGGITLKRLILDDKEKMIILAPLNDEFKPILVNPEEHQDVTLIGSLFYLMRKVV
jgi:SOS-response transcriptional repressor LexA